MVNVIFLLFFAIAAGALASQLARVLYGRHDPVPACVKVEPFIVSDYLEKMDRALVEILQKQEPVDQIIILWWGLDGLTLDENGELKWISRKKPEPVNQIANLIAQMQTCCVQPPRPGYLSMYPTHENFLSCLLNNTFPKEI